MPLRLVTGPANAAKAGEVLGGLRERLDEEPILVVPTFQDVEHAQRELAERGAIFGARVLRFDRLFGELGRRAGYSARAASELQRELLVERAIERAGLELLADSAGQPGFVRAASRFVAELDGSVPGLEPPRFTSALRQWAGDGPRRRYADELAAIYRHYREGLAAAGLVDRELQRWGALDALRREPQRWGVTPLFVYGFDDFTRLELDALETVAVRCGADVVVSLPFEPGRLAFRAVSGIVAELAQLADSTVALEAVSDHYAAASRATSAPAGAGPVRAGRRTARRESAPADTPVDRDAGPGADGSRAGAVAGSRAPSRRRLRARRRRRARRGRAGGGRGADAAARGHAGGRRGGRLPRPGAVRVAAGAGLRRLRHPLLDRPLAAARPHERRPRPARAAALRAARRLRGRPARLAAHAGQARAAAAGGPARGRRAARRRRGRRCRARPLGGAPLAARRAGPRARGRAAAPRS